MIDTSVLRYKILQLAMQGKITKQLPEDGTAEELFLIIQEDKKQLIKQGEIKKGKKLTKIELNEVPYSIPKNWKWVRVGQVINEVIVPQRDKPVFSGNIPWCRIEDRDGNLLNGSKSGKYVSEETIKKMNLKVCPIGTVLAACSGASIGTIIINTVACCTNQTFNGLVCNANFYNWFLFYYLQSTINEQRRMGSGCAMAYISQDKFRSMIMPLPPLSEQKRIVNNLKEAFMILDEIDELQKIYVSDIDVLKRKLVDAAIQGKLTEQLPEDGTAEELYVAMQEEKNKLIKEGKIKKTKLLSAITDDEIPIEIPSNWKWFRLEELAANINIPMADGPFGSNLKKEHYTDNREVRIIQLSNIGAAGWRNENVKYTTFEHLKTIERSAVNAGDIVIAKMMPAGRTIIVPDIEKQYVLSSDCVKFVPHPLLSAKYINYVINSEIFRKQVLGTVTGVGRERTSLSKLKNFLIPIPPYAEQVRIVQKLDTLLGMI